MKSEVCLALLGLLAVALCDDRYQPKQQQQQDGGYKKEERYTETRSYARPEQQRYVHRPSPRGPYYGGPYYMGENPRDVPSQYHRTNRQQYQGGRYYYGGSYNGKCYQDGLYFMDTDSFVLCSNGNAYVQPCAPGTRNSARSQFRSGYYYGYSDFCDVNLVDLGYGPQHYAAPYKGDDSYGSERQEGYGKPKETGYGSEETYKVEQGYGQDRPAYPEADSYHTQGYGDSSYGSESTGYASTKGDDYKPKDEYKSEETYVKESYGDKSEGYKSDSYYQ